MKEEAHEPSDVTYRMDVYLKMAIRFVLEMLTKNTAICVLEVNGLEMDLLRNLDEKSSCDYRC